MLIAYQLLSVIVLVAIPICVATTFVVENYRNKKKTESKQYKFWLKYRNLEFYLIGICYPVKAVLNCLLKWDASVDIIWGIVWVILALMVYKKYKFGVTPLTEE